MANRRVVVTGLGLVTPLGFDIPSFWDALEKGTSGIKTIESFDTSKLNTHFAGEIVKFDAKSFIDKKDRKSLRIMARAIQMSVAGAHLALNEAKVDKDKLDPTRFATMFGAGLLPMELEELGPASQVSTNCTPAHIDLKLWGDQGLAAIPPLWMLKYLPNMHACHISILHNAQGPSNSITESDVAGLLALAETFRLLRRNLADLVLVGGADSKINSMSMIRQMLFKRLSKRNDAPTQACRPFDKSRDGVVIGEGGGVLVVEDLDHAQKRGAHIYGEVLGVGAAFDRGCKGPGLARAMRTAIGQAGINLEDIDHINAQGSSGVATDKFEARAIKEVFGDRVPTVWGVKSYYGNLGSGSGPTELAASFLAMKKGVLPGTLNFAEPDPDCPVTVTASARPITRPCFLKLGFTEMGQCAAIVCRKWN